MASSLTPTERKLRAQLAAFTLHSQVDSRAHTEPARKAANDRFAKQVDPDGLLAPEERARRAEAARRAYFAGLALKSARVRRERAQTEGGAA